MSRYWSKLVGWMDRTDLVAHQAIPFLLHSIRKPSPGTDNRNMAVIKVYC